MSIYLTIFILWAILFYKYTQYWFTKKFAYLEKIQNLKEPKYFSYVRKEKKNCNFWEFYFVGVFLLIPRIILMISSIIIIWTMLKVLTIILKVKDYKKEQKPLFFKISQYLIQLLNRLALISLGFYKITEKTVKFKKAKYPKLKISTNHKKSQIIISNT